MQRATLGRWAAESTVIVESVLLALAADAWWAGRQEATLARGYIFDLQRDFVQMAECLDSSFAYASRGMDAGSSLLEDLSGPNPDVAADSDQVPLLRDGKS